jgi:hypothetical protein
MIVAKHVKRSVDYEAQELLPGRYPLGLGVFPGDLGADINVTNYGATSSDTAEAEGDHVCRTMVPEVAMVQLRHCGSPNERNR